MGSAYGAGWHLPLAWLAWLGTTDLRLWIYEERALYGVIRFLHLVSMACFVGAIAINEFRRLNAAAAASVVPIRGSVIAFMNWSFLVVVLTGIWLFLRDPVGIGLHTMFLPKLVLVTAGAAWSQIVQRPHLLPSARGVRRGIAFASTLLWITVVGFSTWNHVERPVNINAALRATNIGRN